MFQRITIWMISKRWFWSSSNRIGKIKFQLEAQTYKQKQAFAKFRENSVILTNLLGLGVKNLFWVAVFLSFLAYVESSPLNELRTLKPLGDADKSYLIDQLRMYAQILTAIFSIYFATIGIILSAGYTKLRRDIIQLLTSEQVGSIYSRILVFSASFCLAATSLPLFGLEPGYLIYLTGTLLTLVTSLTLFPLGQRLFNYFDLKPLVGGELLPSIAKHIEGAANTTNSDSLANHHSQEARRLLGQLIYIDDSIKEDTKALEENLPSLTEQFSRLLLHYLHKKHEIDQSSYWFPRRRKHRQWFFAGDSATTMALNTSTQLNPEEKPDMNWFENDITKRLESHIELAFKERNYELALTLLGRLSTRISEYALGFHFDVGMNELNGIRCLIETAASQENAAADKDQKKMLIAISDTWATLGSNFCLETLRRIFTLETELADFFEKDEWTAKSMRDLPSFLQVDTAFIINRIKFEQDVEGLRLSQPKYLQQLVVQELLKKYEKILPVICNFYQQQVLEFSRTLLKNENPEAATQVVLVSLHSFWKLPRWFDDLSQLMGRYETYQHYNEKQYVLPRIDASGMVSGFVDARDKAIEMLGSAGLVDHIFSDNYDEDLPDYFGQIYYLLAEECIHALDENLPEKLEKVVRTFVALAILAADTKFPDPNLPVRDEFRISLISSVVKDLASVMGFAILYGEYYDNPILTKTALDAVFTWLDKSPDKKEYLIRMLRFADWRRFSLYAPPRDLIRISWKQAFERRARDDGYGDQMSYTRGKEHNSKIVNAFLKSYSDAAHLFFAIKVLPEIEPVDFELDYHITSLAQRLAENEEPVQ